MHLKRLLSGALCAMMLLALGITGLAAEEYPGAVRIVMDGGTVTADGEAVPADDPAAAVYTAHDIVYYEAGHDFTYGEGTEADEHDAAEAEAHTVVHITQPGTYVLSGTLDPGQIAVDLGKDADEDPGAVVTLVLDGVDLTCTVAPAVIFYNVYECDPDGDQGSEPDLSGAGARVVIADGSENTVNGSYVARIYKSYTLNEEGTAVTDSKKLHKYDGAFYSKMSMTVSGGMASDGVLYINAANEGMDTEMHLLIDGGNIHIRSGNDGINVNEDDVSVVTINGGSVDIVVNGSTSEGDGIDSNGWLVINAGTVTVQACGSSMDSGLDSAQGVYLNGGMVIAAGHMLDPLTPSYQCGALFSFAQRQAGGTTYALTDADGNEIMAFTPENSFTHLLMTSPALEPETDYSLTADGAVLAVSEGGMGMGGRGGFGGGMGHGPALPEGQQPPEMPEGMEGQRPMEPPEGMEQPPEPQEAMEQPPEMPDGKEPGPMPDLPQGEAASEATEVFTLPEGLSFFSVSGS